MTTPTGIASRRLQELVNSIIVPPDPVTAAGGSGGSIGIGSGDREIAFRIPPGGQNAANRPRPDHLTSTALGQSARRPRRELFFQNLAMVEPRLEVAR